MRTNNINIYFIYDRGYDTPCRYSFNNNFIFFLTPFLLVSLVCSTAAPPPQLKPSRDVLILLLLSLLLYLSVRPSYFPGTYVNASASCVYCGTSPWWIVNHGHDGIVIIILIRVRAIYMRIYVCACAMRVRVSGGLSFSERGRSVWMVHARFFFTTGEFQNRCRRCSAVAASSRASFLLIIILLLLRSHSYRILIQYIPTGWPS